MYSCHSTAFLKGKRFVVKTTQYLSSQRGLLGARREHRVYVSIESRFCMMDAHVKDVYLSNLHNACRHCCSPGASLTSHGCFGMAFGREGKTVVPVWNVQRRRRTRQSWRHGGIWHKLCTNVLI
ncbi:hypothetical protein KVT40_001468 [Elsinoe batatas]|uniref:Uncharacterized protein n=1 Tax=Elsinoe batatas TaxID=2601811 RepID=A0A8K0PLE5_9PEZI|nr:hypothetical protein KVT40_001468 [Elsinoe batatas]